MKKEPKSKPPVERDCGKNTSYRSKSPIEKMFNEVAPEVEFVDVVSKSKIMVSHGMKTHKLGAKCKSCDKVQAEWLDAKAYLKGYNACVNKMLFKLETKGVTKLNGEKMPPEDIEAIMDLFKAFKVEISDEVFE